MAMGLFRLMVHCSLLLLLSARTVPHSTRDELFRFSLAGQRSTTTSRRDTPGGQEGGGAFEFASGNFSSLVKSTAANHNGPLLIHSEGKVHVHVAIATAGGWGWFYMYYLCLSHLQRYYNIVWYWNCNTRWYLVSLCSILASQTP